MCVSMCMCVYVYVCVYVCVHHTAGLVRSALVQMWRCLLCSGAKQATCRMFAHIPYLCPIQRRAVDLPAP